MHVWQAALISIARPVGDCEHPVYETLVMLLISVLPIGLRLPCIRVLAQLTAAAVLLRLVVLCHACSDELITFVGRSHACAEVDGLLQAVKKQEDSDLLVLDTDNCLFVDEDFKPYAEKYAADQDAFFADYVKAHLKLSELGVEWDSEPITLD